MPKVVYRKDYQPLCYHIHHIDLTLELDPHQTQVQSQLHIQRTEHGNSNEPLVLDGKDLTLQSVSVNEKKLKPSEYELTEKTLTIKKIPKSCVVTIENSIDPTANTSCMGLYRSNGDYTTQCESENFRRITFFQDRPDNLATYTTTVIADKKNNPLMLSNGNCIDKKSLSDGRHACTFHDPIPKPSYLFALVAGQLRTVHDVYMTDDGRIVDLNIHVKGNKISKTEHAMHALQKAFEWDERVYQLPYDLDVYHIVGVPDFNAGAMENKGLNIFNASSLLVNSQTSTDADFEWIYTVVGHEFFHNYAGNRVTIRNWFELALKEGLATQKEREFLADTIGYTMPRIKDVTLLKTSQFPEDAGPTAHPVRNDSYVDIRNFYTRTTYEKGAELLSMLSGLLGQEVWRNGVGEYFRRLDGQAATIDQFLSILSEVSGKDLTQFARWYSQAGTPQLDFNDHYDQENKTYTLTIKQSCPPTPGQLEKLPFHIPIKMGRLDQQGYEFPLQLEGEKQSHGTERILELTEEQQSFTFVGISSKPIPSLLRDFSAPVRVGQTVVSQEDLPFLMANDTNKFNVWDAAQQLHEHMLLKVVRDLEQGRKPTLTNEYCEVNQSILNDEALAPELRAAICTLPNFNILLNKMEHFDPEVLKKAYDFVSLSLAQHQETTIRQLYKQMQQNCKDEYSPEFAGMRALKNMALKRLVLLGAELDKSEYIKWAKKQLTLSLNMTDRLAALSALVSHPQSHVQMLAQNMMEQFYNTWQDDEQVIDMWLSLQACYQGKDALEHIKDMFKHPAFDMKNPNSHYALTRTFITNNPTVFHDKSGKGYALIADLLIELDSLNVDVASRMAKAFVLNSKLDPLRMRLMLKECQRIHDTPNLSSTLSEIIDKAMDDFSQQLAKVHDEVPDTQETYGSSILVQFNQSASKDVSKDTPQKVPSSERLSIKI